MHSRAQRFGLSTLLILSLASCRFQARPFGWFEPGAGEMSMGCLDGALETLAHFAQGKASAQETKDVFTCADTSLVMFTSMISGNEPGSYSAAELRNLLQTVFLKQFKISDALFTESLRLKQAFLGGDAQRFSASDIKRVRKLLAILGNQAATMAQDQPLLPETVVGWSPERMDEALARVHQAGQEVAAWLDEASGSYKFSEFESLMNRMEETGFFADTDSGKMIQEIRKWLPFIRLAKSLLVDGNSDELKSKDWGTLVRMGARGYSIVLRLENLSKHSASWILGDDRARLVGMGRNFLGLLTDAIENRSSHVISATELSTLFDLLPLQIPTEKKVVFQLLPHVLDRFFGNPKPVLNGQLAPTQVDRDRLARITQDFETWAQTQETIERKYIGPRAVTESPRAYETPAVQIADEITQNAMGELESAGNGLALLFQESGTPTYRMHLSGLNANGRPNAWALSVRNWTRAIARVIVRGYTPRANQWKERKLSFDDFWRMFLDFKPTLETLGMTNAGIPMTKTLMSELFHLTDLVNPSSNGDALVSELELSEEIIAFLSSAEMGAHLERLTLNECREPTASCVKSVFLHNFESVFESFPDLLEDWRGLSISERVRSMNYAQFMAQHREKPDDELYVTGEYMAFITAWHQLELLFARYDGNHDRIANEKEALRAFPLFADLLQSMAAKQNPGMAGLLNGKLLESVFTYIIAKDEDPQKNILDLFFGWFLLPGAREKYTQVKRFDLIRRLAVQRKTYPTEEL